MKHLYLAASAAMVLTLAACGDNNEAQLTELQGQLETAQTENETLRGQVSELEALDLGADELDALEAEHRRRQLDDPLELLAGQGAAAPVALDFPKSRGFFAGWLVHGKRALRQTISATMTDRS